MNRAAATAIDVPVEAAAPGPLREFVTHYAANRGALAATGVFALIVLAAVFAPWLAPFDPVEQFRDHLLTPPSWHDAGQTRFLLGTDELGRDILSRLIHGARISLMIGLLSVLIAHIKSGKLKALAVTGAHRYSLLPDVPTMIESGVKDFEANAWNGVLVAAGTPAEIVTRLNREIDGILKDPEVKARLNTAGLDPVGGTPDAFRALIKGETDRWTPVIKATGAKID